MNRNSILLKISVSFFIALLAITALFNVIEKHEIVNEKNKLREHYHHMAMAIMKWKMGMIEHSQLMATLKKENITLIEDPKLHQEIKQSVTADEAACSLGNFFIYEQGTYRYVIIPPIFGKILLRDNSIDPIDVSYVWWLYEAFVLTMVLLFVSILISLHPLKKLQQQVHRFGEGDIDINFATTKKDEISELANEFDKAAKKIKNVLEARQVFLRNITHELKTPVTSGKLALELLGDSKSKNVLNNVFTRLELLLKEFVHIEKITATNQILQFKEYPLTDILDQATDMLFLEPNTIKNNFFKNSATVNFELFTFVFKNLIDNGLKYAIDDDFYIDYDTDKIHFISRGDELERDLEYYLQPFTKSDDDLSQSFGLGLYIVDKILKTHHFHLTYEHLNGYNFFTINT